LRLLFYVGVPFAALVLGHDAVTSRFLGLQPLATPTSGQTDADAVVANWRDWTRDIGWAVALGIALGLFLAIAWWRHRRALREIGAVPHCTAAAASAWLVFREAAYHEVHWAFYRNAPIMALGPYWGTWIGLTFVGLEASLNPAWRRALGDAQHSAYTLMRVSLALASSLLFLQTENLWLAMVVHFGVSLGLTALARSSSTVAQTIAGP
jgi:membrane protease YdiL (CAAX protease family)